VEAIAPFTRSFDRGKRDGSNRKSPGVLRGSTKEAECSARSLPRGSLRFLPFNVQNGKGVPSVGANASRLSCNSRSWTMGSVQRFIVPDPTNSNNVYVVAAEDPTNNTQGCGIDDSSIHASRSTDNGNGWSRPTSQPVDMRAGHDGLFAIVKSWA
jgi:hypothetical protein